MRRKKHKVQAKADIALAATTAPSGTTLTNAHLLILQTSGSSESLQTWGKVKSGLLAKGLYLLGRKMALVGIPILCTLLHCLQARTQLFYGTKQIGPASSNRKGTHKAPFLASKNKPSGPSVAPQPDESQLGIFIKQVRLFHNHLQNYEIIAETKEEACRKFYSLPTGFSFKDFEWKISARVRTFCLIISLLFLPLLSNVKNLLNGQGGYSNFKGYLYLCLMITSYHQKDKKN